MADVRSSRGRWPRCSPGTNDPASSWPARPDGRDFVKGVAGAWVDETHVARAAATRGIDWSRIAEQNDTFIGLRTLDQLIDGSSTGWNLCDIYRRLACVTYVRRTTLSGSSPFRIRVIWVCNETRHSRQRRGRRAANVRRDQDVLKGEEGMSFGQRFGSVTSRARRIRPRPRVGQQRVGIGDRTRAPRSPGARRRASSTGTRRRRGACVSR